MIIRGDNEGYYEHKREGILSVGVVWGFRRTRFARYVSSKTDNMICLLARSTDEASVVVGRSPDCGQSPIKFAGVLLQAVA